MKVSTSFFFRFCFISNLRQIFHSNDTNTIGQCEIYDLTADFMLLITWFPLKNNDFVPTMATAMYLSPGSTPMTFVSFH